MPGAALSQPGGASLAQNALLAFKNLFLPAFCRKCRTRILTEENLYFCSTCWASIELARSPKCPRCGRPHPARPGFEPAEDFVCSDCSGQKQWVDHIFAAGLHAGALRDAIHLLKYQKKRLLVKPLARLLFETVIAKVDVSTYDMIVPVPLHPKRQRARGYNQSELIAAQLCRLQEVAAPAGDGDCSKAKQRGHDSGFSRDLFVSPDLEPAGTVPRAEELAGRSRGAFTAASILRRVKDTPNFTLLGAPERHELIRNAFQMAPGADVKKKRILLLDDVVTTGATSNECAKTLRKAGAASIDVIALAVAGRL